MSTTSSDFEIVYEDDVLLVVSKPQGMVVHPAPGAGRGTLVERLRDYYATKGFPDRHVGAVSRLDRGTSGLVLLATDRAAHPGLHRQVVRRQIKREYRCLVWGRPLFEETLVDVPLGRHWADISRMAAYDLPETEAARWGARPSRTRFQVLQRFKGAALLSATLETGRMHQIRAHLQFIRLPVIGDPVYGSGQAYAPAGAGDPALSPDSVGQGDPTEPVAYGLSAEVVAARLRWQCLHAGRLQFQHPLTGEPMNFHASPPAAFTEMLAALQEGPSQ